MTKKTKQVLLIVFLLILVIFQKNTHVYATAEQEKAFQDFTKIEYKTNYTLYLGELMDAVPFDISDYIDIEVSSSNTEAVSTSENPETRTHQLQGLKKGESNIVVTATYDNKIEKKRFKVKVDTTTTSTKLDSKTNDVLSINSISKKQTQILLANNELWNTSETTFKLSKKETGNVSKYVYTSVYSNYSKSLENGGYDKEVITALLKKDSTLTLNNFDQTYKVSNVKEISNDGYLNKDGEYHQYIISKDAKLTSEKILDDVTHLIGDGLVVKKDEKTYTVSGVKLFDFKAIDCNEYARISYGYVVNSKGEIYCYEYDFMNDKYITKRIANNAKGFINNFLYETKSGDIKKLDNNDYYIDTSVVKNVYMYNYNSYNVLTLKHNNRLYLNGKKILDSVDNIYYANGTKGTIALIVRNDGSIWRLKLNGNSSLVKLRSGKDSEKKISKPTKLEVSKSGKNNIKLKWSEIEGASGYTIYRSTSKNGKYKKIGTSKTNKYTNKKVDIGKTFYYKVVANHSNSNYNSSRSSYVKIKIPKVPTKFKATKKSKSSIKVTFNKVSKASGYEIVYSLNKDFKKDYTKSTKRNNYTLKSLKKNKTYYVKVRAYETINGKKVYSSFTSKIKVKLK